MTSDRTVVALFARSEDAHQAINNLIDSGISPDRIGYLEPVDEQALTNPGTTAGKGIQPARPRVPSSAGCLRLRP